MGILMYNSPPASQYLKNASFECPITKLNPNSTFNFSTNTDNWFSLESTAISKTTSGISLTNEVTRDSDNVSFGSHSIKLKGNSSIFQIGDFSVLEGAFHTVEGGPVAATFLNNAWTLSALVKGDSRNLLNLNRLASLALKNTHLLFKFEILDLTKTFFQN